MQRRIRVLVGKPGLDGHDRGAKVVAAALRDAGMEVIYTGLHQSPEQVVEAALQEDVDVVALSILSGAHMTLFPEVMELMKQRGIGDRLLTGGGIIPAEDMQALHQLGVGELFGPGASTRDIVQYIRDWFTSRHGAAALAPLPSPAAPAPAVEWAEAGSRGHHTAAQAMRTGARAPARPRKRAPQRQRARRAAAAPQGKRGAARKRAKRTR
jgi:methylmalonyl-CoA mutase C-terminal domain/subunit